MSAFTQGPVVILTPKDARMLWQIAKLNELRIKHRSDPYVYDVLHTIYKGTLLEPAERGNETRQTAATEERDYWTTRQVAKAAGVSERTVRSHCADKTLPAEHTRNNGPWLIPKDQALTYIHWKRNRP
ncbi:helix-turn-helix domain-containing protein [Microbacterium sp. S1037]|uniref:helix-turn-helix domain-containing protein n=1 Tax=Microbacterium sp. S1037 TaxID=3398227 RepID=UPI003AAE6520